MVRASHDGTNDLTADPPCRISWEFETFRVVKFISLASISPILPSWIKSRTAYSQQQLRLLETKVASAKRCFLPSHHFQQRWPILFLFVIKEELPQSLWEFTYEQGRDLSWEFEPRSSSSVNSSGFGASTTYLDEGFPSLSVIEIPPCQKVINHQHQNKWDNKFFCDFIINCCIAFCGYEDTNPATQALNAVFCFSLPCVTPYLVFGRWASAGSYRCIHMSPWLLDCPLICLLCLRKSCSLKKWFHIFNSLDFFKTGFKVVKSH